jgi:predicted RNA-binding Zn ribbon-like protein
MVVLNIMMFSWDIYGERQKMDEIGTGLETQGSQFEFSGNDLCLDFVNTVESRLSNPVDLLQTYHDLLVWGQQAQLLTDTQAQRLHEKARVHPDQAISVLHWAFNVRELLYRIFQEIFHGKKPGDVDMTVFNKELAGAMSHACLISGHEDFIWGWNEQDALESIVWSVIRSAADLLTSTELKDVRMCAADNCGWLFLDTSKNHSRRWCDMKTCGNRAKAKKHYSQKIRGER